MRADVGCKVGACKVGALHEEMLYLGNGPRIREGGGEEE